VNEKQQENHSDFFTISLKNKKNLDTVTSIEKLSENMVYNHPGDI